MAKPISVQLYSVRKAIADDPWGTLETIAAMGYVGVEPCGVIGGDIEEMARRINDLGLTVSAVQTGTPVGDDANRLMDEAEALGTTHIVCPSHDVANWQDADGIEKTAERFEEAIARTAERNMTFGYHNHEFELAVIDGTPGLLKLAERLAELTFTVDTYWVNVGGQDPVEVVTALGAQANVLHIKDGPLVKGEPMVAAGAGMMDFPPIVEAATGAEWLVVELDTCATDMLAAVEQSIKYLVDTGLGRAIWSKGSP
ncbi:MAG: TIM barrel protein [Planctomycetes bacterium]|jgi:sugar phosphate isomerase/epimerase|nr:sugar phosphate isomerase/epimerase [Phycisphaerae bacterium]NBB95916.1 TIM barrel protein [Planctomycetota bacterium]